jgi:ADP-ribose pyrophosphatase YjhB (NUDIX family)
MNQSVPNTNSTLRVFTQAYVGVGAIIEHQGKILLVQEGKERARGKWNDPGGWIDLGENPIDAIIREVKEETNLVFVPTDILGIYNSVKRDPETKKILGHCLKVMFRGTWSGELHCDQKEILDLQWFSEQELLNMDHTTLRNLDIRRYLKDFFAGERHSLEILHT